MTHTIRTAALLFILALLTTESLWSQERPLLHPSISGSESQTSLFPSSKLNLPSFLSPLLASSVDSVPDGKNENWQTSFGVAGTEGIVRALRSDGDDLFIGGSFNYLGGTELHHIARWDGNEWTGLGPERANGVDGTVYSILVDGDNVYVGGGFRYAGGKPARNVALWNRKTNEWSPLGEGLGGVLGSSVRSMAIYNGELYVAGRFVVAGKTVAVNIARWDGSEWHRVGTGINDLVYQIGVDEGYLYAVGMFSVAGDLETARIARYRLDAQRWEALPNTELAPTDVIAALEFDQDYVYVGGRFNSISGRLVNNVARFNKSSQTWSDLAGGVTNTRKSTGFAVEVHQNGIGPIVVLALRLRGDDLFAGGDFDNLVSNPRMSSNDAMNTPRDIAKWNTKNQTWSMFQRKGIISNYTYPSSGVMKGSVSVGGTAELRESAIVRDDQSTEVYAFEPGPGDGIYIGGYFDMAGPFYVLPDVAVEANRILPDYEATFVGNICMLSEQDTLWSPVGSRGIDDFIFDMVSDGDRVYAGGKFQRASGKIVNNVAAYDKRTGLWSGLGTGVERTIYEYGALTLARQGNSLYVGGDFHAAGGTPARGLARWDISSSTWSAIPSSPFTVVRAIKPIGSGNDIVVAGDSLVGIWNGTTWDMAPNPPLGRIYSLAVWGDTVFVGGKFSTAGGQPASNIVLYNRLDRTWHPLKQGVNDTLFAMDIWDGNLFVGGNFTLAGNRYSVDIARWDIDVDLWDPVGTSGFNGTTQRPQAIKSMKVGRYGVYFGGDFQGPAFSFVTSRANGIAMWDGSTFRALANGIVKITGNGPGSEETPPLGTVYALCTDDSSLFVGGDFQYAGAKSSNRFAQWIYPVKDPNSEPANTTTPATSIATTDRISTFRNEAELQGEWIAEHSDRDNKGSTLPSLQSLPDDQYWDDRFGTDRLVPGTNDEVFAMAADGTDLYIGGVFTKTAGIEANSIVKWNGVDWEVLDDGVANGISGFVFDILVDGENIYVAGQFDRAGGTAAANIAVWNNATRTWKALGSGVAGDGVNVPFISTMTFYNGDLYVGGNFTTAGGKPAKNIAKWDGNSWSAVGSGVDGSVNALQVFEGKLFVGGRFGVAGNISATGFAWYEDGDYHTTAGGVDGYINDFTIMNNRLILGGKFTVARANVFYLSGSITIYGPRSNVVGWTMRLPEGEYIHVDEQGESLEEVRTLVADTVRHRLYTGGIFTFVPEPTLYTQKFVSPIIRNFGYNYQDMGWRDTGITGFSPWLSLATGTNGPVNAIALMGDDVFVGGSFTSAGNGENYADVLNVAKVNARLRNWHALISGRTLSFVSALTLRKGDLFAAGPFTEREDPSDHLDNENQIATLGTTGWRRFRGIMNGEAYTIATVGDSIVIGGRYFTSNNRIGVNLSLFDPVNQTWHALTPGSGVADQEEDAFVNVVTADDRYIYVGGMFGVVDTFETPNIAAYDRTTRVWRNLGNGLDGTVWSLTIGPDGRLYAGGEFQHSGTVRMNRVAYWDGTTWNPVGEGTDGIVRAIAYGDGRLYAGGTFTHAGSITTENIAAWNIDQQIWEGVGSGLSSTFLPAVNSLAWYRGRLYAGGFFQRSGSDTISNIARWQNGQWERLGSGTSHAVWNILPDREQIYVAGAFDKAGAKSSPYIGIWHDPTLSVDERPVAALLPLLDGAGPNPFSEETTIRYSIPLPDHVEITIHNEMGRLVDRLLSDREESGSHQIAWHPSTSVAAGVYFCRMTYRGRSLVARVIRHE